MVDARQILANSMQGRVDEGDPLAWLNGFGGTAVQSIPHLFGMEFSPGVQAWQENHPVAGLGAEIS